MDNFFLPRIRYLVYTIFKNTNGNIVKASTRKTPQPTPAALFLTQTPNQVIGTNDRLSNLRYDCLIRDHHRCIISHKFDKRVAKARAKEDGINCKDDDGRLLRNEIEEPEFLEVAHILPHCLTSVSRNSGNQELV